MATVLSILERKGHEVMTVTGEQRIAAAAELLDAHRIGALPVVDHAGAVVGILSERDIVRGISRQGSAVTAAPVAALMSTAVTGCAPMDTVDALMEVMTQQRIRHLPVIRNGRLSGMISIGDLVKVRLEEIQQEVDSLRTYIAS